MSVNYCLMVLKYPQGLIMSIFHVLVDLWFIFLQEMAVQWSCPFLESIDLGF